MKDLLFKESKTQVYVKWDCKGNCPGLKGKILRRELFQNEPEEVRQEILKT